MTAGLEPAVPGLPALPADPGHPLVLATAGWLAAHKQKSINTHNAYRRDVIGIGTDGGPAKMPVPAWLPWCDQIGLNPLAARRGDVDLYSNLITTAKLSPATWARKISAVSSWYDYLISEEIIDRNPAKIATRPSIDRDISPATGVDDKEIDPFLDQAEKDGLRTNALICMLYFGGLRLGSVLAANFGDLQWEGGDRVLWLTVKGGKKRRVYLEPEAVEPLDDYLASRGEVEDDDPLFVTSTGARLDEAYCWRLVRRLARQAGMKSWAQLSPHSLRHTHITHALDAGVAREVVQDNMGHADDRTTRRYDRARNLRKNRSGSPLSERRRKVKEQRLGGEAPPHLSDCWRSPDHHACAVALIERQAAENDELLVRVAMLERSC